MINQTSHPGPRPLPLHMAVQTLMAMSSLAALPSLKSGSINWKPRLKKQAESLQKDLRNADPELFRAALEEQSRRQLAAFADGVRGYRAMPPTSRPEPPPAIWQSGTTRLLDYGVVNEKAANGPPLLVIPSLINRAYIVDLHSQRSLMRYLAARGVRPLLIDWGDGEPDFNLDDYICGRLSQALTAAQDLAGQPVTLLGYCMGGLLALALAQLRPEQIKALVLLATPWDFSAMDEGKTRLLRAILPQLEKTIDLGGTLPVDVMQALFAGLAPNLTPTKFRAFAELDPKSDRARQFTALEDWVNDGVPLAGPVARQCLNGWYIENTPGRGQWRVG
ncbi:MAG TPA: alpha/beta fold hydrolase, partial [Rhodospirillales bacterium]|nr:alpha/beta fold hydrolase [Rhodospirillales bacterium]